MAAKKETGGSIFARADKDVTASYGWLFEEQLPNHLCLWGARLEHEYQKADIYCEVYGLHDFYYCKRLG